MKHLCQFLVLCVALSACGKGPSVDALKTELQSQLDDQLGANLFSVRAMSRQGNQSFDDPDSGEHRQVFYFDATLEFLQDLTIGSWADLSLASLAHILGAAEQGITGINPEGNKAGDVLRVHGSSLYRERDGEWQPVAYQSRKPTPASAIAFDNVAPRPPNEALLETLTALVRKPGRSAAETEAITDELRTAERNINLRLDRLNNIASLASGDVDGEYYAIGQVIEFRARGPGFQIRNHATAGSVENLGLVNEGKVDFGLAQTDLAAMAYRADSLFETSTPMSELRSLGSLFPEPMQIVVSKSSAIQSVEDLRGKMIGIGLPGSGSRVNALMVLDAHGLFESDFTKVLEADLAGSVAALRSGQLDALFVTVAAPARELQNLAATFPMRILSLSSAAIERLREASPYFVPTRLPAHTYPSQEEAVDTLSVTAMLVTLEQTPFDQVDQLLETVFTALAQSNQRLGAALVSKENAQKGLSIPLHPAAEAYYARQ